MMEPRQIRRFFQATSTTQTVYEATTEYCSTATGIIFARQLIIRYYFVV